jgi:single-stranded-DNA-specific exonuclease
MHWKLAKPNMTLVKELTRALNIPQLLAVLLVNRGIVEAETARRFLDPRLEHLGDPFLIRDLEKALGRIFDAIDRQEKILIYGDYDVDGTTAVVILHKALTLLGAETSYHIPRRLVDGYGMKSDVIEQAATQGVKLIISVDTGIKAYDVVDKASSLGLDCIITDHHLPEDGLPNAYAVLNPKRSDCPYPDKELSGVGVAFKLVQALFIRSHKEKLLPPFLKIVAIGTIADVVPLLGENRVFAKLGLEGLQIPVNAGLRHLIQISGLGGKSITSSDVGYRLAPRINAVGRMSSGEQAVELFVSTDEERSRLLAAEMNQLNRERQQIEDQILKCIEERFLLEPELCEDAIIVISGEGWHRGVIGIAATKLTERFHRPALVISCDGNLGFGSGRGPRHIHLLDAMESCRDLFDRFGGHAQAVGFQIAQEKIPELRRRLNQFALSRVPQQEFEPVLEVDAEIRLSDLDEALYEQIERLAPFGTGNPQPVFLVRDLAVIAEPRILKGKHLKFRVEQDGRALDVLGWNMAHFQPLIMQAQGNLTVAFVLTQNDFQQMKTLQLLIKDLQVT